MASAGTQIKSTPPGEVQDGGGGLFLIDQKALDFPGQLTREVTGSHRYSSAYQAGTLLRIWATTAFRTIGVRLALWPSKRCGAGFAPPD
jgi:hypothetical protein